MNRGTKVTLLSLAAGGLIGGLVFGLVSQASRPFFSPPDEPREWARDKFDETFLPAPSGSGLPTVSAVEPLIFSLAREPGKRSLKLEGHDRNEFRTAYEIFPADSSGEVVLPSGNRMRLSGIAMVMPEDVVGGDRNEGGMVDLDWQDPVTLEVLSAEETRDWNPRRWVSGETPELFIRISNEGGEAVRWLGATAFDDRTLVRAENGSAYYSHEKDGQIGMELDLWHQTRLRIAVNFSFGKPVLREFELKENVEVHFDDDAYVKVVDVLPRHIHSRGRSASTVGGVSHQTLSFGFRQDSASGGDQKRRGAIFHVWPPHNEKLIDFVLEERKTPGSKHYLNAWGGDGITTAEFPETSELLSVQARRMPRLGRAVFLLPKIPRLPETDNLFDTPITRVELGYPNHMVDLIRKGAAVQWDGWSGRSVSDVHFPMTLENTTPAEVLGLEVELVGRPLFFDRNELKITAKRSGLLTDLEAWWRKKKPAWLP